MPPKPQSYDRLDTFFFLLRTTRFGSRSFALLFGLSILAAASEFLSIALLMPLFDIISGGGADMPARFGFFSGIGSFLDGLSSSAQLAIIAMSVVGLQILRETAIFFFEVVALRIKTDFDVRLREDVYDRILNMDIPSYYRASAGELYTILGGYTGNAGSLIFAGLMIAPNVLLLGVYSIGLLWVDWQLTLLTVTVTLIVAVGLAPILRRQNYYGNILRENAMDVTQRTVDLVNALPLIRSCRREDFMRSGFLSTLRTYRASSVGAGIYSAAVGPIQRIFSLLMVSVLIVVFTFFRDTDSADWGEIFLVFLFILSRVGAPVTSINAQRASIAQLLPATFHLRGFMEANPQAEPQRQAEFEQFQNEICFTNVSFSYDESKASVLHDVSLSIAQGKTTALVGQSGAGKSTILGLVQGLYFPSKGEITVDGRTLGKSNVGSWRRRLAVVGQQPFLFNTTISDNIRFGKLDATDGEIEEAARMANIADFIETLPNKYNEKVGERGMQLSGGQAQRLSIARAILAQPDLLILDEATSAQDARSEALIRETLDKLSDRLTVLVVAHRLSTVRDASKIIVMQDGRVVEVGTHETLMSQGGPYAELVQRQTNV